MSNSSLIFVGGYASVAQPGVCAFDFDEDTGVFTPLGSCDGIERPSFIALHPNGQWLFAVSEMNQAENGAHGALVALRVQRDVAGRAVTFERLNQQPTDGDWPCHIALDPSGKWAITSNYGTGNVSVHLIGSDGSLGAMSDFKQHEGSSVNADRQERAHAHSATFTPDGGFVVVADLGMDQLVVYAFDAAAGKLSEHARVKTRPGVGPRHMAFHPSGRWAYVANELDSSTGVYAYDGRGGLRELQVVGALPPGAPDNTSADIHVSADGARVYQSNRGHNSIAVFDVGADGRLSFRGAPSCDGEIPRNFALSRGGKFVLVANQNSDRLSALPVQADGAGLGAAVSRVSVIRPSCIVFAA